VRRFRSWFAFARGDNVVFVLVTVSSFAIYLRTLAPGVLDGDSGEFQFAAWGWTLAHPTGYPLYLLIGGLAEHLLPFGNPAYRLNVLSAVFAALAVGVSYRVYLDLTEQRGVAMIAALTLAVSPTFWSQATETEVYALNSLFIALLVYLALKWDSLREFKYSALWALTLGLALAHHRSMILLIPSFAAFLVFAVYKRPPPHPVSGAYPVWRRGAAYSLLAGLPLLLYAYVPLRGGVEAYAELYVSPAQSIVTFVNTPVGWLSYISGQAFQYELAFNAASVASLAGLPGHLLAEFNPLGVALGALGLVVLLLQRRVGLAALTLFGFVAIVLFNAAYHIGDIHDFYTPAYWLYALWIAAGLGGLFKAVREKMRLQRGTLPFIALLVIAAALPLENFSHSFVEQDRSLDDQWATRWQTILTYKLPANAILVSNDRDEMTPMWYLQIVEGLRPDLLGLFPLISDDPAYANTTRLVASVIDSGRPVFLIKPMPGLGVRFRLEPTPPDLFRVASNGFPYPQFPSHALLADQLRVTGYSVLAGTPQPASDLTIGVYWQPLVTLDRNYTSSLQLFDNAGRKVAQADDHKPGWDVYPTSLWQPGETLQDVFRLSLPSIVPAGTYKLGVRMYDGDETLGDLTEIGNLQVKP
jgi:transmembrane protein TMEM260 (protein O-mannosyltransferase)